jgi:hypothetical protein
MWVSAMGIVLCAVMLLAANRPARAVATADLDWVTGGSACELRKLTLSQCAFSNSTCVGGTIYYRYLGAHTCSTAQTDASCNGYKLKWDATTDPLETDSCAERWIGCNNCSSFDLTGCDFDDWVPASRTCYLDDSAVGPRGGCVN